MRYALVFLLVIAGSGAVPARSQPTAPPSPGSIFDPPPGSPPPAPPAAPRRDIPSPPTVPNVQPRRIDLMALADVQQDAVHGKWKLKSDITVQQDGVESDNAKDAGLEFPYQPPAEYDMIAVFQPQDDKDCVCLIGVQNGHSFQLNVASMNKWGGLDVVNGARAFHERNPTRTEMSLHAKRLYTLLLQVRRDRIRAFLNGTSFVDYRTTGSDLSVDPKWQLRRPGVLAIQSCLNPTIFNSVQVIEISGPGQVLHGSASSPQPAVTPADGPLFLPDGKWARRWTERGTGADQVYAIYDGGKRAKAFSWNLEFTHEANGSIGLPGSHFFMTFTRAAKKIVVREWHTRADYDQGKEPISIGVLDVP